MNIFNVSLPSALTVHNTHLCRQLISPQNLTSVKVQLQFMKVMWKKNVNAAKLFYILDSNINVARGPGLETQLPQSRSVHFDISL